MANWSLIGRIARIKYLQGSVIVSVEEYRRGFKKKDGTVVPEQSFMWDIVYRSSYHKFISEHFGQGMIVNVKGDIVPYSLRDGEQVDGYAIAGQTINLASYPKDLFRQNKMAKESQEHSDTPPDVEAFMQSDF